MQTSLKVVQVTSGLTYPLDLVAIMQYLDSETQIAHAHTGPLTQVNRVSTNISIRVKTDNSSD